MLRVPFRRDCAAAWICGGGFSRKKSSVSAPRKLDLLQQAATQVKPGGVLVYSTCSLEPEENQELVKQFLSDHAGFKTGEANANCCRSQIRWMEHL